jgi:hypothetical protein
MFIYELDIRFDIDSLIYLDDISAISSIEIDKDVGIISVVDLPYKNLYLLASKYK